MVKKCKKSQVLRKKDNKCVSRNSESCRRVLGQKRRFQKIKI